MFIVLDSGGADVAQSFTLKVGSLDLAQYLRASPGEGFDPADGDYAEPTFSKSPLREGAEFIQDVVGLREVVWPLALKAASKDALHDLIRDINRELDRPELLVEWKDSGATTSSFYDVARGRLELDYSFRRAQHFWCWAMLRIWVQPYAHMATNRIVATAAGTGALITAQLPALSGDAPAVLRDTDVRVGSMVRADDQVVALSIIPAGWTARVPAASLFVSTGDVGATVFGASGAAGSQYAGAHVPASSVSRTFIGRFKIPNATAQMGPNRALALVDSQLSPHVALQLEGLSWGIRPGRPTALVAYASPAWRLVDLGVINVPDYQGTPSQSPSVDLYAQVPTNGGQQALASPSLKVNELYLLPEDNTALIHHARATSAHSTVDTVSQGDIFRFDERRPLRLDASGYYIDQVSRDTRGAVPIAMPGTPSQLAAALVAKLPAFGLSPPPPQNDTLSMTVRVRERFRYSRGA